MKYRPVFHFSPPFGWMNDPNGLCQFDGKYHMFYQYYPFGVSWDDMHWGHAISEDLIHWNHYPIALRPDELYDKDGVFSGSALVENGTLYLYYTGNTWLDEKREALKQVQCLATSTDGVTFLKHPNNPIICDEPFQGNAHVRDPKVWKQDDHYYMILGTRDESDGKVVIYSSPDRINWFEHGIIAGETGQHGWMWECPDVFSLDGQDILIVSPQGMEEAGDRFKNLHQCGYFVGELDLEEPKFTHGDFTELDYGHDFYAAQTFLDNSGRRILIAWHAMWERTWPEQAEGWANQMTIPRELSLHDGRLHMNPIQEMISLRNTSFLLTEPMFHGKAFELTFHVLGNFEFDCFKGTIRLSYKNKRMSLDRDGDIRALNVDATSIRIFVDSSSIEVFINDGAYVFSSRMYPINDAPHRLHGQVEHATIHLFD